MDEHIFLQEYKLNYLLKQSQRLFVGQSKSGKNSTRFGDMKCKNLHHKSSGSREFFLIVDDFQVIFSRGICRIEREMS